jgi:CRP/FNR family cyclic AMP-dependent transcriptional regulator
LIDNLFLRDLTPQQYELVAGLFDKISVPARTLICKQGAAATYLYVLLRGNVTVRYKPYDGPRITLTRLHPGDVFGWSSVVGNEAYTSDAIGTTPVEALRLRGEHLRSLCAEHPAAGSSILKKLAEAVSPRWLYAQRQVQSLLTREVFPQR